MLAAAALTAIAGLGLLQSCRWPEPAARLLSPRHAELYGRPRPHRRIAAGLSFGEPGELARRGAGLAGRRALLMAAQSLGASARNRRLVAGALLLAALVQGGVSVVAAGGADAADGLLRPGGRFHGTYANPNHLALLCEIGLAVALAWMWWSGGSAAGVLDPSPRAAGCRPR